MAVGLGKNISSIQIANSLNRVSKSLGGVFERLSSGQRINGASPEPMGLAVASGFELNSRLASRAHLNISDGVSALHLAGTATSEISYMLTRMAELAEQAANGTITSDQRKSLSKEYEALDQEIRRITSTTQFNGMNILQGNKSSRASSQMSGSSYPSAFDYALSGDGKWAVRSEQGSATLFNMETGETTTVVDGMGLNTPKVVIDMDGNVIYSRNNNLFYWDRETQTKTKLTDKQGADTYSVLEFSSDGSTVVFSSRTVYTDGGTKDDTAGFDAREHLHSLNIDSGIFKTDGRNWTSLESLTVSPDGSKITFVSSTDLAGTGNSSKNVFSFDFDAATYAYKQLTSLSGNFSGTIAGIDNSSNVYFTSADDFGYGSGIDQIYKYDNSASSLIKLSDFTEDGDFRGLTLNADGSSLFYFSNANNTGENPDGIHQAFRYDVYHGKETQLTEYTSAFTDITLSTVQFSLDGLTMSYREGTLGSYIDKVDISPEEYSFKIDTGTGINGQIQFNLDAIQGALKGLGSYTLSTEEHSKLALDAVKSNIDALNQLTGDIGAGINRLDAANEVSLNSATENDVAASKIRDVDVAEETAELIRQSVLRDVITAVYAQANQQIGVSLKLLNEDS